MTPDMLFFSAGIVGITSMLMMGIGFLKSQPKNPGAQLFFLISLCIVCYIFNIMGFRSINPAYRIEYGRIFFVIQWIPNAIPGLFMIFCHRIFQEDRKFPRWLLVVFFINLSQCALWNYVYDYMDQAPSLLNNKTANEIGNFVIDITLLAFSAGGIYWTIKDWRNDLIEGRRVLRWLFISLQGLIIFLVVLSENFIATTDSSYLLSQQITLYVIAVFGFTMAMLMTQFDYALLGDVIEKVGLTEKPEPNDKELDIDTEEFERLFIGKKLYRETGLTIAELASKLAMPEYRLRSLINKRLGYRNFNAMLHHYRIEDASDVLADRDRKNIPILTIALDVGYKSITPFNAAFRDLKAVTPSEFRKKALQEQLGMPEITD